MLLIKWDSPLPWESIKLKFLKHCLQKNCKRYYIPIYQGNAKQCNLACNDKFVARILYDKSHIHT